MAMIVAGPLKILTNGTKVIKGAGAEISEVQKFVPNTYGSPSANALKNAADNGKLVKKDR